jgi:hypothetical protein
MAASVRRLRVLYGPWRTALNLARPWFNRNRSAREHSLVRQRLLYWRTDYSSV